MKKKILSALMVLAMMLSLLPTTALAGNVGDTFTSNDVHYRITGEKTVAVISNTETDTQHSTYTGEITIPETVENEGVSYTVTEISGIAFERSSVTKVTVPKTVKEIKRQAFYSCTSLEEVVLSEGLQIIGDDAFSGCGQLKTLSLPSTVKELGSDAFESCTALVSLEIPSGVTNDLFKALETYPNAGNITFADGSPYSIETGVLYNGNALEGWIDKSVTKIVVRNGVTEIPSGAFGSAYTTNPQITSITLPDSVTKIGEGAFRNADITEVDLSHIIEIGDQAFSECGNLADVTWPENLKSMGNEAFNLCESLKDVKIQGSITEIPDMAFCGCVSLESVILPEGLTNIGDYAFDLTVKDENGDYVNPDPKLESINIPSTVTSLGENFLGGVKANGETKLISQVADPSIFTEDALSGISGSGVNQPTLIYPEVYKEAYEGENSPVGGLISSEDSGSELKYSLSIPETASVDAGKTTSLTVTATVPAGADLSVESSASSVAIASLSGSTITVTGVAAGSATVTASIKLNGITLTSDTCTVTVSAAQQPETPVEPSVPSTPSTPSVSDDDDDDGGYSVSVPSSSSVRGGGITVSPRSADKGDTVSITLKPDEGYVLDQLTVTDGSGDELKLTWESDNRCTFTMPGSRVDIQVSFKPIETAPANPFADVSSSAYYYDAVLWAVANGVTNGTSATAFSPNVTVSRAQMVTFLWRAHGAPRAAGANLFTDVSADAYYYDAVLWAVESGVTNGTSATTFSPDAPVTRAQAVTFQWRAAGAPAMSGGSFGDVAAGAYYAGAVTWAVESGITNGTGADSFSPDAAVSRAQAVTFLYRELAE